MTGRILHILCELPCGSSSAGLVCMSVIRMACADAARAGADKAWS